MNKGFDSWNEEKKKVEKREGVEKIFYHEREVWWCNLGLNIGVETDGKNENYERPMLVVRKFNSHMFWALPLTSRTHSGEYYFKVEHEGGVSWVMLTQFNTISTKRLIRKIGTISASDFHAVVEAVHSYLP